MSEFKGTKGKWEIEFDTASLQKHIKCGNKYIAEVSFGNVENNSNAKLIESAPEMLGFLYSIESSENTPAEYRRQAKQLIKKATEL